jgi:hypothetical protein
MMQRADDQPGELQMTHVIYEIVEHDKLSNRRDRPVTEVRG